MSRRRLRNPSGIRSSRQVSTITCPDCGLKILIKYIEGHKRIHEQAKNHPIPTKPVGALSAPIEKDHHRIVERGIVVNGPPSEPVSSSGHDSSVHGDWYRDEDGELCFGTPKGAVSQQHNAEKAMWKPTPADPPVPQVNKVPIPKYTRPTNSLPSIFCPACETRITKDKIQSHLLEHPHLAFCPACDLVLRKIDFGEHVRYHYDWCPICQKQSPGIKRHMEQDHHLSLKGMKIQHLLLSDWQIRPVFTCLHCNKQISLVEYPDHQHQAPERAEPKVIPQKLQTASQLSCPVCRKGIADIYLKDHLFNEHAQCPYCSKQMNRSTLISHIGRAHPGKPVPEELLNPFIQV